MVSIGGSLMGQELNFSDKKIIYIGISYTISGLVTTTLMVTRAVVIRNPFRVLQKRRVLKARFLISISIAEINLVIELSLDNVRLSCIVGSAGILLEIAISSDAIAFIIFDLKSPELSENQMIRMRNRRVTTTVMLFGLVFIVTNFSGTAAIIFIGVKDQRNVDLWVFSWTFASLCLNAFLNPIVYLVTVRMKNLRLLCCVNTPSSGYM